MVALQREVDSLRQSVHRLSNDNSILRDQAAALVDRTHTLENEHTLAAQSIDQLNDLNASLQHQLRQVSSFF